MIRQLASRLAQTACSKRAAVHVVNVRFHSTDYSAKCEGLAVEPKNQVLWLKLDRPHKYNAITREMYIHITETLTKVNADESIRAVVLTGNGDYYSSGNDLTNFTAAMQHEDGLRGGLTVSKDILIKFVESLINLEKFCMAAVNGPAVGISVTTLPLFDYVIASDKATFHTPFTALGQCPEACSSVTLPKIMGRSRASELLLLNMTWNAKKAANYGLVSDVVEHEKFHAHVDKLLNGIIESCYPSSMMVSKSLMMEPGMKQKLLETNRRESEAILGCWLGEESADAVQKFLQRSKK